MTEKLKKIDKNNSIKVVEIVIIRKLDKLIFMILKYHNHNLQIKRS